MSLYYQRDRAKMGGSRMIKPFKEQCADAEYKAIIIEHYLKFINSKRDFETKLVYKTGYWNVFWYTKELHDFVKENNIGHRLIKHLEKWI
jgi:hypothetical protein